MTTVGAVWETETDREKEDLAMRRMCGEPSRAYRLPKFSLVDFVVAEGDSIKAFVEVKVRKEPLEQVKKYGGLMLKHRKISELAYLSEVTNVRSFFVFAFESGRGDLLIADATALHSVGFEECDPPPRGRDRGKPACDFEKVAFLDWGVHVHPVSRVFSQGAAIHPTLGRVRMTEADAREGDASYASPKKGRPLFEVFAEDPWPDVFRVRDDLQST